MSVASSSFEIVTPVHGGLKNTLAIGTVEPGSSPTSSPPSPDSDKKRSSLDLPLPDPVFQKPSSRPMSFLSTADSESVYSMASAPSQYHLAFAQGGKYDRRRSRMTLDSSVYDVEEGTSTAESGQLATQGSSSYSFLQNPPPPLSIAPRTHKQTSRSARAGKIRPLPSIPQSPDPVAHFSTLRQ